MHPDDPKTSDRKIRLVVLIDRYAPIIGGAERSVHDLLTGLREKGYSATVLTRRVQPDLPRQESLAGITVNRFAYARNLLLSKLLCAIAFCWWLVRNQSKYDLVLCVPCAHITDLLPAYLVRRWTGKPYVIRTTSSVNFDHWLGTRQARARARQQSIRLVPRALWRRAVRAADAIVVISSLLQQRALAYGIHGVELIFKGIDLDRFVPAAPQTRRCLRKKLCLPTTETCIVLSTGRYDRAKNFFALVAAAEVLAREHDDGTFLILIVGASEDYRNEVVRETLLEYVERTHLGRSVWLRENVTNVNDYLQAADVFVFPSIHEEGMSSSLMEAIASGLPIVASDLPQIAGEIPPRLLVTFDPNSSTDLAEKISLFMTSPDERAERGEALAIYARSRFSLPRMVGEYDRLFTRISRGARSDKGTGESDG